MKCESLDIKKMLEEVARRTKKSLVREHFRHMYYAMEKSNGKLPFSEDYLYRKIFLKVKDATDENNKTISLNTQNIEAIATFLGYKGFIEFKDDLISVYPFLENCIGSWYSYVRCNSGEEDVLISPVRIYKEGNEIFLELKGKSRMFKGKLKFEGNCMYCLLESKQDKNLHLVFKIGFAKAPNVLQGVFSGMSTAGDPIAGREILVRQAKEYVALINDKRSIRKLMQSKLGEEKIIGTYFKEAQQNILKAGVASTFELNDLKK